MSQQLTFFETPKPEFGRFSLFLAILPDSEKAHRIFELGTMLRDKHGLSGWLRPPDILHVSLIQMGGCSEVPQHVAPGIGQVCETVAALIPSFEVRFDQVMSFRGGTDKLPLVLVSKEDNPTLLKVRRLLLEEFKKRRWPGVRLSGSKPHITLLYDAKRIQEEPVDPVRWMVNEIVMVCSDVGVTKYQKLGRWMLGG